MKLLLGTISIFLLALTSCATKPSPYYLLDLTEAKFPIMLSGDVVEGQYKTFQFNTGTRNITATASSGKNTVTVSHSSTIAPVFSEQVANIFLQDPILVYVKNYSFNWEFEDRVFTTLTNKEFLLKLNAFSKVDE